MNKKNGDGPKSQGRLRFGFRKDAVLVFVEDGYEIKYIKRFREPDLVRANLQEH